MSAKKSKNVPINIGISDGDREKIVRGLSALLADSFALYLKTKNYHWHVQGPHFRELHLLFDEQATQILGTTDLIAERVRKNGAATLRFKPWNHLLEEPQSTADIDIHRSLPFIMTNGFQRIHF